MGVAARFKLSVRCEGCRKMSTHMLDVPEADDAPCDVDELLCSAFLSWQSFTCRHCDCPIGQIVAASQAQTHDVPVCTL